MGRAIAFCILLIHKYEYVVLYNQNAALCKNNAKKLCYISPHHNCILYETAFGDRRRLYKTMA